MRRYSLANSRFLGCESFNLLDSCFNELLEACGDKLPKEVDTWACMQVPHYRQFIWRSISVDHSLEKSGKIIINSHNSRYTMKRKNEETIRYVLEVDRRLMVLKQFLERRLLRASDAATKTGRSLQNMSRALRELERKGLVLALSPKKRSWKRYMLSREGEHVLNELKSRNLLWTRYSSRYWRGHIREIVLEHWYSKWAASIGKLKDHEQFLPANLNGKCISAR